MAALLLYLDQNYLSGMVKQKPAFRELEPVVRAAVARGAVAVPESPSHRLESTARPDLPLLELLRELSSGMRLPARGGALERSCERRLGVILEHDFPERRARASDALDLRALACPAAMPTRHLRCRHGRPRAQERPARSLSQRALHRPPTRRAPAARTA